MQRFDAAPWSRSLKAMSVLASTVLAAVALALVAHPGATGSPNPARAFIFVPGTIIVGALLFVVRGYEMDGRTLWVRRLLWRTPVALDGLEAAVHDANAMARSRRVFGNGGVFSITGVYSNDALGRYRAFVTDPAHAVVLRLRGRVVVVSPSHPHAFLQFLARHFPQARVSAPAA